MPKSLRRFSGSALVFLLLCCMPAMAWSQAIKGVVSSSVDGTPLIGATVVLKGTETGVLTDENGTYTIPANQGDVLVVGFIGFLTQEVTITGSEMNVSLEPEDLNLTEVVITGYTAQNKEDLTGSISVIDAEEIRALPTGNVANQLQGRAAGVTVVSDGRPGSPSKVRIRGFGSFQNNDPLYVVDGVPTQDISTLNPNDIATTSVLKDAGAASIYGSRAANGVIIMTTKQGKQGIHVNYNGFTGVQLPGSGPTNLLSAQEYADLQWLVYANDDIEEEHPIYGPSSQASPSLPSWAANTDWWGTVTRNARVQSHDVSLSGGNDKARFFTSLNYYEQQGVIIETQARRFSGRFNSSFNLGDRVTIGENFTVTHTSRTRDVSNLEEDIPINWVYRAQSIIPAIITDPIQGVTHNFQPGDYGGTGIAPRLGNGENPLAIAQRDADDFRFDVRGLGSVFADIRIFDGLNFRSTFGGTFQVGYFNDYTFATYENAENVATASFNEGADFLGDWVWTNMFTFDRDFGAHSVQAIAGYEAVKYDIGRGVSGAAAGYFSDALSFRTLTNGATVLNANSFSRTPTSLVSTFLRGDYAYNNKYLISATVRRDGSSRFGAENRFGVFPSVTAAWRIGQEDFLRNNSVISDLKIRGGYGTMGNQLAISPQNAFFLFGGSPGTSFYAIDGSTGSSSQGFRPTQNGNPDAKWETNVTTNIGFDASLFNNRLEIILDWYTKTTQDLLFNPEQPATVGAASAPFVNIAQMRNTGIDAQVIYRNQFARDLNFEANLTFTTYTNEIVALADGVDFFDFGDSRIGAFNRNQVGQAISEFYGYQVLGLFESEDAVAAAPTQDGAEAGFFQYADINGFDDEGELTGSPDGQIDDADRTFIGNPNPDFTAGLNLTTNYKGFDLTAFFFASYGNDVLNYTKWWTDFWPSFQGQKSNDLLFNSWTPSNTDATVPKASNQSNFSTNTVVNGYYVEDGSFLRLRNLQLGYTLPSSAASKLGMESTRIYIQATNLFTLTNYTGVDPELGGDDRAFGVDEGNFPIVRQFLIGLNLGF